MTVTPQGDEDSESRVKLAVEEEDDDAAYNAWYEANLFYNALSRAADAVREEAARAFKLGKDDVAFALREMAKELDYKAKVEANEWEKARAPK